MYHRSIFYEKTVVLCGTLFFVGYSLCGQSAVKFDTLSYPGPNSGDSLTTAIKTIKDLNDSSFSNPEKFIKKQIQLAWIPDRQDSTIQNTRQYETLTNEKLTKVAKIYEIDHGTKANPPTRPDSTLIQDAGTLYSISRNFYRLGHFTRAMRYQRYVIDIYTKIDDKRNLAKAYSFMGQINNSAGNAKDSEIYHYRAGQMFKEDRASDALSKNYIFWGELHFNNKDYESALIMLDSALFTNGGRAEKEKYSEYDARIYANKAYSYWHLGKFSEAKEAALKCYEISKKLENIYFIKAAAKILYLVSKVSSNEKESLYYIELYSGIADTIQSLNLKDRLHDQRVDFNLKTQHLLESSRARIVRNNWIAASIISAITVILLFLIIRNLGHKKLNKLLSAKNLDLEASNEEKRKILISKNELELKIKSIQKAIAADLHDNFGNRVGNILTFSDILKGLRESEDFSGDQFKIFLDQLEKNVYIFNHDIKDLIWANDPSNNSIDSILARLDSSLGQMEELTDIKINFKNYVESVVIELPQMANRQLLLILKEAVNNAIKYSKSTTIDIIIENNDEGNLIFKVVDYGIGFDKKSLSRNSGLNNMKMRAASIDFKLSLISTLGKGTTIKIQGN